MNQAEFLFSDPAAAPACSQVHAAVRPGGGLCFLFVWLFLVAIYARPEDIVPKLGELHLTFVLGACAALTYIWSFLTGDVELVWPREFLILLALTAWFIAGVPFAYWRGGSLAVLTHIWLKTLFIFFLMTQILLSLARIYAVLWAIILSELAVTAYSIAASSQVRWVGDRLYGVSMGILGWNFLGIAAAITIPYIAALFLRQRSMFKCALLAAACGSLLWMLALTASRSGVLSVAVSLFLTWWWVLRGHSRGKLLGAAMALALLATVCLAPSVFWERMQTMLSSDSSGASSQDAASAAMSEDSRLSVLLQSIEYTIEHPVFGLGLGNLEPARGNELNRPDAWIGSHNTFTEISSEAGIPALLLFLGLLFQSAQSMKRILRAADSAPGDPGLKLLAGATLASLVSFAFGACFAHIGYEYFLYTCPIALAVGIQRVIAAEPPLTGEASASSLPPESQLLTPGWSA